MSNDTTSYNSTWDGVWDDEEYPDFNPFAPFVGSRRISQLTVTCFCNLLALLIIVVRTRIQYKRHKRLQVQDWWIIVAGLFILLLLFPSRIANARYGFGLHWMNIPGDQRQPLFDLYQFVLIYFGITTLLKISICCHHLSLLPHSFVVFRNCIKILAVAIGILGITVHLLYVFQCTPIASNFLYSVEPNTCMNWNTMGYAWVVCSVCIDILILLIPFRIVHMTNLRTYERRAIVMVFSANLIGTVACLLSVWGIHYAGANFQSLWNGVFYIIFNDIEILAYTFGVSFPVFIPIILRRVAEAYTDASPSQGSYLLFPRRLRQMFSRGSSEARASQDSVPSGSATDNEPSSRDHSDSNIQLAHGVIDLEAYKAKREIPVTPHSGPPGERVQGWTIAMESRGTDSKIEDGD